MLGLSGQRGVLVKFRKQGIGIGIDIIAVYAEPA